MKRFKLAARIVGALALSVVMATGTATASFAASGGPQVPDSSISGVSKQN
jgi:hypothetical protein